VLSTALLVRLVFAAFLSFAWAKDSEIVQILKDPKNPAAAWALSKTELRYSEDPRGGRWETRFEGSDLKKLVGRNDVEVEFLKIAPATSERGALFLVAETTGGGRPKQRYTVVGRNVGQNWKMFSTAKPPAARHTAQENAPPPVATPAPPPKSVASPLPARPGAPRAAHAAPARPNPTPAPNSAPVSTGGSIDLASLDSGSGSANSSSAAVSSSPPSGGLGIPEFKFMFDFWLYHRPSIAPLTFSNIHTLAMVDIFPVPELQFSFELSPTPRWYQLSYQLTPKWELRAGRIWIPFDLIGPQFPHNIFGGYVNVSQFRQPGGTAFLPDIWTDLGVALKYQLADTAKLNWSLQMYVVNGFQDGGNDPSAQVGTKYPNFESAAAIDNNSDKSFGFRSHMLFHNRLGLGVSGYMGRYTDASDEGKRVVMLGLDAQMKFGFGLDVKAGYAFMSVGLVTPATTPSFRRGGVYIEGTQRVHRTWKLFARAGTVQNDSRVIGVDDVTMFGGGIIYTLGYLQLTVMYQHDLNTVTAKTSYDFMATRAAIML